MKAFRCKEFVNIDGSPDRDGSPYLEIFLSGEIPKGGMHSGG
jgi:hypothetical protein